MNQTFNLKNNLRGIVAFSRKMKKKKTDTAINPSDLAEDWDLNEDFGIIPKAISITQNIGCVRDTSKKSSTTNSKKEK